MAEERWCTDPGDGFSAVRTKFVRNNAQNLTEITYICRPGLEPGGGSLEIQCAPPGNWSSQPPNCVEPQGE